MLALILQFFLSNCHIGCTNDVNYQMKFVQIKSIKCISIVFISLCSKIEFRKQNYPKLWPKTKVSGRVQVRNGKIAGS